MVIFICYCKITKICIAKCIYPFIEIIFYFIQSPIHNRWRNFKFDMQHLEYNR